jgi:redox-sensing transcriptional repressor
MGHALARYQGFVNRGFLVTMVFDNDPAKIGQVIGSLTVLDANNMVETIREAGIQIAMLTVPASAAQGVADKLVEAGVKAILNYAPISLNVPEGVRLQYLDPSIGLQRMTYYLE